MKYHPDDLTKNFKSQLRQQKLSEGTIRFYISDVRVFLRFIYQVSGDYEITPEMFESYENFLKSGTLPTKTINRKLSSLRIFSTFLLKQGFLKENFMNKVKNNKSKGGNTRPFKASPTIILLSVFIIVLLVGSFVFTAGNKDIFSITTSPIIDQQKPITLTDTLKTTTSKPPEILQAQSINDITVEGNVPEKEATVTTYGKDAINSGKQEVKIVTASTNSSDLMFITPTSPIDSSFYVEQKSGVFVVHLQQTQQKDFTFNWMLVSNQLPIDKLPR